MKIGIIVSRFNDKYSEKLLQGAEKALKQHGLKNNDWEVFDVPGALEIAALAKRLVNSKQYKGIIALGCVIKGETDHYKAVCEGTTYGIQKVAVENSFPIMFGVLMCASVDQAIYRSMDNNRNKGYESAKGLLSLLKHFK